MIFLIKISIIFHLVSPLITTNCIARGNRKFNQKSSVPTYEIYKSERLPHDVQISTQLTRGVMKRFFYESPVDQGDLSVTLIACTSPIKWSFYKNQTRSDNHHHQLVTISMDTYHVAADGTSISGIYILEMLAPERDSLVHVYVSTEKGGPQALQQQNSTPGYQKLRLLKRQRRKQLTVKWNPSLVDPQGTTYCVVVNSEQHYKTLCSIETTSQNPWIICVGRRTHCTLSNVKRGPTYYIDIFATNHQSNLTYRYISAETKFNDSYKPINLKDAKATFANLKKLDGKAVFRYKISKISTAKSLDLFVMPCGGAIDVEISLKDASVIPPQRVEGFGKISVPDPKRGARYYIKIFAMNREELRKTTGVEVIIYATTRNITRIPLPNMPQEMKIKEYAALRTCDSVTIAYIAAPLQKIVRYCLVVKEGRMRDYEDDANDGFKMQNQCGLESRLKKSPDFDAKYCKDVKYDKEEVVIQKVPGLKPSRHYIVQVTVKKPKGKTLSYNLLQVSTKKSCRDRKNLV